MWTLKRRRLVLWLTRFSLCTLFLVTLAPKLHAGDDDEFDSYKIRLSGFYVYSNPSGDFQGSNDSGTVDFQRDLGFNSYSTFAGKLDWKFTHKNHFYFLASPFNSSRQTVLTRTIVFQGQTFEAGLTTKGTLDSPLYGFGYQYDIIRRKRGHLGLALQLNLFDTKASISAAAQINGGVPHPAVSASNSLLAPIPVAGPEFRLYLTNSPRLFVEGNVYGMYFFGYGNYVSAAGSVGVTVAKHLSLNAGYQLGTRLIVNNDGNSDRIGLRMTQKGPIAGVQLSF